jgi:TPR repeat protein
METPEQRRLSAQRGAVSRHTLIVALAVVVVAAAAVFLFYPREALPPESATPPRAPATSEERGDTARDAIAELQSESDPPDYAAAYQRAREFQDEGRLADAQLMYFFAARGGDPDAAFALGSMNDPNHFSPESSLMQKPDAFQAYKWYVQARDAGDSVADQRLMELHAWAEQQADEGNSEAEQLLVQWE